MMASYVLMRTAPKLKGKKAKFGDLPFNTIFRFKGGLYCKCGKRFAEHRLTHGLQAFKPNCVVVI